MEILEDERAGIVIVTLTRGELILESLGEVARQADIHSGVVMSGIGSVTRARIHTVLTNDYPPRVDAPLRFKVWQSDLQQILLRGNGGVEFRPDAIRPPTAASVRADISHLGQHPVA